MGLFDRILFVLGETLIAVWRNRALAFAAVTTVAVSLYVIAGMIYAGGRATAYLDTLPGRFEMTINLKEGTNYAGIARTAKYLRLAPGVAHVVWIPRQRRWALEKAAHPDLTEGYGFDDSPYPDALKVTLNDLGKSDAVASTAHKMTTVDPLGGVQYFGDAQNAVARWIPFVKTIARWTGGLLLAVAGILIVTAIQLAVEYRRVEIRIMRLVGASRVVVALPFVLEGIIQGAIGGFLAAAALRATHQLVEKQLGALAMGVDLAPFPFRLYLSALCLFGGGYGGLCSLVAFRTPRRARHG